jgi:hypothetical protein
MTAAVIALAVVAALALAALVWRDRSARMAADTGRRRVARAEARVSEAESRAGDALTRLERSEQERQEAAALAQSASDRVLQADARLAVARRQAEADRAALEGLWRLAVIESRRAWQLTMAQALPGGTGAPASLAGSLAAEVERIREETGTPGTMRSALAAEPAPVEAVLALRAVQTLLAVLSRYCDSYDLALSGDGGKVVATLNCDRFAGGEPVLADARAVADAVVPCGGSLDLREAPGGQLCARLHLPGSRQLSY